jgi:hypothetical protein
VDKRKKNKPRTYLKEISVKMATDFLPPSREIVERVRAEFGLDECSIKEAVEMLKDWLLLQPHLRKVGGKYAAVEHSIFTV